MISTPQTYLCIESINLEQTRNLSCFIYIDSFSSRYFWKSWHGHDFTCQSYDKACTCGNLQVTNSYFKVCRCAQFCLVICLAVLSLSNTNRTVAKSHCFKLCSLFLSICSQNNSLTTINFLNDVIQFIFDASL